MTTPVSAAAPLYLDLFAGPGGFDEGAAPLGIDFLGIEWDEAACATRRARGWSTLQADVAALDVEELRPYTVTGLVGGPPCQAFSMAGKGAGRAAIDTYRTAIERMAAGETVDIAELDRVCEDPRAHLVLEPLRWILACNPRWVVLEQVKEVLPVWAAYCTALRRLGYSAWCGVLNAEEYGVPQTRRRAILIASLDREVHPPEPTHRPYVHPSRRQDLGDQGGLFDADEGTLPPPVSMAQALGWASGDRVGFPRLNDRDDGGEYRERDLRDASEPAFALTEKARSWQRWRFCATNERPNAALRELDEPGRWVYDRPATTVQGDPRIFSPGGHIANDGRDNTKMVGRSEDAIRVSIEEAAILQSFPPDYPWQGTKSKQFQQVGNAIPPLLARACLSVVAA